MRCFCHNRNFRDIWKDGKTPYELRFRKKFADLCIPFGAKVHYLQTSAAETELQRKAGPRMLEGVFVGYKLTPGGCWHGEYLVYDKEAFENTKQGQYVKEHTTKEVYLPGCSADDKGKLSFPVDDKTYKQVHVPTGIKNILQNK